MAGEDGTELETGPGDVLEIPPVHDAAITVRLVSASPISYVEEDANGNPHDVRDPRRS